MKYILSILFMLIFMITNTRHQVDFDYPLKDIKKVCGNSIYPRDSEREIIYPSNYIYKKIKSED